MGECGLHQTGGRRFKLNLPQVSHNRLLNKLLHNRLECMVMIMTTDPPTNFPSLPQSLPLFSNCTQPVLES